MNFDKLKADMALYAKGEQQILEIVDIMDEAVRRAYDETGVLPIFLGVYLVELASSLVRIGETHEEWHEFGEFLERVSERVIRFSNHQEDIINCVSGPFPDVPERKS